MTYSGKKKKTEKSYGKNSVCKYRIECVGAEENYKTSVGLSKGREGGRGTDLCNCWETSVFGGKAVLGTLYPGVCTLG